MKAVASPGKRLSTPAPSFSAALQVTLIQVEIVLVIVGLFLGSALVSEALIKNYRVNAQVSQLAALDEAVANFHAKYQGMPGDLLAVTAQKEGLPFGNGTAGHGDGDGKISPCNLGWQWHLGCETALFWSHLSVSGMVRQNFTADSRFAESRLTHVGAMDPYLPQSPLAEGVYVAVWNTDESQPSPRPRLPYGNYYELSRIQGVEQENMIDDFHAITPEQAKAIDMKTDDGMPLSGHMVVNGEARWPKDAWGTYAKPGVSNCVFTDKTYNTYYFLRSHTPLCHIAIKLPCCKK